MKKTYTFWVSASVEVEINGSEAIHKSLNAAISDDDITINNYPQAYTILKHAGISQNDVNIDWSDIMSLSVKS